MAKPQPFMPQFMPTLNAILGLLLTYTYWIIFPIAVVEGPIIAVLTGWLAGADIVNIYISFALLLFADMVGDALYYSLGRFGGNPSLKRWGHFIGINEEKLIRLESHFNKHAYKYLLFGKTQAFGGALLAAAGVVKMPFIQFMFISVLGSAPKILILLLIGFFFGKAYVQIDNYLTRAGLISFGIVLVVVTIYLIKKRQKA